MILYHGSNLEIQTIDLTRCRPYKDFGQGFYLTEIQEQAKHMAQRVARIYGGNPVVTSFQFDERILEGLGMRLYRFEKPTEEWALFVMNNRNRSYRDQTGRLSNHDKQYDIVIGSIADDDLALLFRQFSNGMIDMKFMVKNMEYKRLTNQYSFHTIKAVTLLKKAGVSNG